MPTARNNLHARGMLAGAAIACVCFVATSSTPASAAAPAGTQVATLELGKRGTALRASGVKFRPTGKGVFRFNTLGLTVSDVSVKGASAGTLVLKDGFTLRKGRKSVRVRGMLVTVKGRNVTVSAKIGNKRSALFAGRSQAGPTVDGGRIALNVRATKLSLTSGALKQLKRKLPGYRPRSRAAGTFLANAYVIAPPIEGISTIDPDQARLCAPSGIPSPADPARPVSAVEIACASFIWAPRSSWISYAELNTPIAPAAALPPIDPANHYCRIQPATIVDAYYYSLPFAGGWWDAASGTGAAWFAGGINYRYDAHGMNITTSEIEIRFNGALSEIWANVKHLDVPGGERIKLAVFDSGAPTAGGPLAPGTASTRFNHDLTPYAANSVFLQYGSDPRFGCFDVGFGV